MAYCSDCGALLTEGSNFCHVCGSNVRSAEAVPESEEFVSFVKKAEETVELPPVRPEPAPNASTYVVNAPAEVPASAEYDRQSLLDMMRKKLRGECITWRVVSILNIVVYVLLWFGLFVSMFSLAFSELTYESDYYYDDGHYDFYDEYYYDEPYEDPYEEYTSSSVEVRPMTSDPLYTEELYIGIIMFCYFGVVFGLYLLIPSAVIGFIMSAKAGKCLKSLYTDCTLAYCRCSSPAIIIFSAIFNPLTLIFTIPAFRLARNNSALFREISDMQKNYYGTNY